MIKLSKFVRDVGITKTTAYVWRREGKLSFITTATGRNFVDEETYAKFTGKRELAEMRVVVYCRVSSSENCKYLDTQVERLLSYCNAKGWKVDKVVTEMGSGINDRRPKLEKLLSDPGQFTHIVVEHKDRLTRMGFNYIETLLKSMGKHIEVVNCTEDAKEDIINDFVSIITSYCSKIYGNRHSKRKTERLIAELNSECDE